MMAPKRLGSAIRRRTNSGRPKGHEKCRYEHWLSCCLGVGMGTGRVSQLHLFFAMEERARKLDMDMKDSPRWSPYTSGWNRSTTQWHLWCLAYGQARRHRHITRYLARAQCLCVLIDAFASTPALVNSRCLPRIDRYRVLPLAYCSYHALTIHHLLVRPRFPDLFANRVLLIDL